MQYGYGYKPPKNKYRNHKVTVNGILFDSKKEASRYSELMLLERAGVISDLQMQKKFRLIPTLRDGHGKIIERECYYRADFTYKDTDGELVVEDTKGVKTPEYIIKRKLMLERHGIRIKEI